MGLLLPLVDSIYIKSGGFIGHGGSGIYAEYFGESCLLINKNLIY